MENEKDEKVVSSTTQKEDEKDVKTDSSTEDKDAKEKSSDSEVPWHKDPRFKQDLGLLKVAKNLMEANGLEDIDDLKDLVESGRKVHGKKLDLDNLEEIVKKADTLDRYNEHWKRQEEINKRNTESPEETISRLQRERDEVAGKYAQREATDTETREAKKAVSFYEAEVKSVVGEIEGITNLEKDFLAYTLGVGNGCNEIQITDKKQIKRVTNEALKKYNNLAKALKDEGIKEYLAGKSSIPKVASTDGTAVATKIEPPKGLKNLRSAFQDAMKPKSGS